MFERLNINFKMTIGRWVLFTNALVVIALTTYAYLSLTRLSGSEEKSVYSFDVITPSVEALNDFMLLVSRSQMYSTNWVYLTGNNSEDRESLHELHIYDFPQIRERISTLKRDWANADNIHEVDSAIIAFDEILQEEERIMELLSTPSAYSNSYKLSRAKQKLHEFIIPNSEIILRQLQLLKADKIKEKQLAASEVKQSYNVLAFIIRMIGVFLIFILVSLTAFSYYSISKPIRTVSRQMMRLSEGVVPEQVKIRANNEEVRLMQAALGKLVDAFRSNAEFAKNIGQGKYSQEFSPLSSEDILGNSLLEMRDNLNTLAEDGRKRNRTNEGVALFGEILRENVNDLNEFSNNLIRELVRYIDGNQGAVFILSNEEDEIGPYLEMTGCYAWDKYKGLENRIHKGEGLAGQAWRESDTVYVTEIPDDYVFITSGLGYANPTSILIVPLKAGDKIYGVIEMAFFKPLDKHEIELVERVADGFASTIFSIQNNKRTQKLLRESQEMTEEMRAQEEEMRQNMEELQATQEVAERKSREAESQLSAINRSVAMLIADPKGKITSINERYLRILSYKSEELVNAPLLTIMPSNDRGINAFQKGMEELHQGHAFEGEFKRVGKDGNTIWVRGVFYPVMSSNKSLEHIIHIATEITTQKEQALELRKALKEHESALEQMQAQEHIMQDAFRDLEKARVDSEEKNLKLTEALKKQEESVEKLITKEQEMQKAYLEAKKAKEDSEEKNDQLEVLLKEQREIVRQIQEQEEMLLKNFNTLQRSQQESVSTRKKLHQLQKEHQELLKREASGKETIAELEKKIRDLQSD